MQRGEGRPDVPRRISLAPGGDGSERCAALLLRPHAGIHPHRRAAEAPSSSAKGLTRGQISPITAVGTRDSVPQLCFYFGQLWWTSESRATEAFAAAGGFPFPCAAALPALLLGLSLQSAHCLPRGYHAEPDCHPGSSARSTCSSAGPVTLPAGGGEPLAHTIEATE